MKAIFVLTALLLYATTAQSTVERSAIAKFHGTLIVVECSLNGGQREVVNFGDAVGIHRIDGKRYEQPVPFRLDCQNYTGGKMPEMTLMIEGTATSFNNAAVATNVDGLGIEIRSNDTPLPLNQALEIDYASQPVLTAVPVADPATELQEGGFTATVKLTVEIP
ncbi:TPA: fimbrial protein [Enterobacter cancerogenus]